MAAAIWIPARLVFGLQETAGFFVSEVILTLLFSVDVVLRLRGRGTSFTPLWLAVDVVAALPLLLLPTHPAFQLLRLLKVGRVIQTVQQFWRRHIHQSLALRIITFNVVLAFATHWLSCGWLALRGLDRDSTAWANYISGTYFSIATLTTVGFGDVVPLTNVERLYVIGMMVLGVAVYGFAIGNVASMLSQINPARAHYVENMEKLDGFMRYKRLPLALRKRMTEYYVHLWDQRLGFDESSILNSLPESLRVDVSLHLKKDIVEKVPLFKDASEGFVKEIALGVSSTIFLPGDYVVRAGDPGTEMYFVSKGELEVISKDGQTLFSTLQDGDFFGEIALILNQPRTASVRATTYCDLYRLDRPLFERVLSHYPDVAAKIHERAAERHARS